MSFSESEILSFVTNNNQEIDENKLLQKLKNQDFKDTFIQYKFIKSTNIPTFVPIDEVKPQPLVVFGKLKSDPSNNVETSKIVRCNFKEGWIYTNSESLYKLEKNNK